MVLFSEIGCVGVWFCFLKSGVLAFGFVFWAGLSKSLLEYGTSPTLLRTTLTMTNTRMRMRMKAQSLLTSFCLLGEIHVRRPSTIWEFSR